MVNKRDYDYVTINVKELFYLLFHKLWILITSFLLGTVGLFLISKYLITPIYASSTKVYLINRQDEERLTFSDLQMGTQLTKDYSILVKGRYVLEHVIERYDLDIDYVSLADLVEVYTPQDSRILEIKVSYYEPEMARLLADAITELSSDRMIEIMDMKEVNVLENANYPTEAYSPKVIKNTIIGGLLSIALSSTIIIINHLLNNNISNANDIETHLEISVLGIVPLDKSKVSKKRMKARAVPQ